MSGLKASGRPSGTRGLVPGQRVPGAWEYEAPRGFAGDGEREYAMKRSARKLYLLFGLLLVLLGLTVTTGYAQPQTQQKVSAPGQYSGYTSPEYKSWTTTSQYVTMRDGVRIAVDVYMPADGPAQDKFPTILIMTPYHRASVTDKGEILTPLNSEPRSAPKDFLCSCPTDTSSWWPT